MDAIVETPEMPAVFDGMKLAAVAAVLYIIVRSLNLKNPTAPPDLLYQDTALTRYLIKSCPLLTKEYIPPLIWGKSGHIQTALYGKMGRVSSPNPYGLRKYLTMPDGATATFDLFEPLAEHCTGENVTMVICPGIANHSEKQYIRTFVDYAQKNGYRCAVLNHLGALTNIELTSPRMFTYGCTWEFGAMVNYIKKAFPQTQLIVVGFSLGGNIVCKYLGETASNQERVLCCVSVCQGYSASHAQDTFLQWDQLRRFYNFLMADNMKKIILSHRQILFGDSSKTNRVLEDTDLSRLYTATSLMQIDDVIMRTLVPGHSTSVLDRNFILLSQHRYYFIQPGHHGLLYEKKENVMVVLPLHGGHLGFFEGAVLFPEPLTWMDKLIVQYSNAICQWERNKSQCSDVVQAAESDHK
ncbi:hypothetical protein XELAEV_18018361mg [Xenopus laevis]|uniref:Monoacylglycerol lipase ABHD2 n=1 Tax=Xenopus laevis TaxID=8355 RepID=A0A974DFK5_XENLA|nr:hypothetical protein XELAEV_18018361mg [Xenopus laevis]